GRATDAGGEVTTGQTQAVVAMSGGRLIGKAGPVKGGEQPVARAIAGENPAGAIAAVRRRRQAANQHACLVVAEAGDGPAPIFLILISGPFFSRCLFSPMHQPRTAATGDDAFVEQAEAFC